MQKINIKLLPFEGPLDLLLHLIQTNKINIYDIPIAELTDQYIDYINSHGIMEMDNVSEFLVMASKLLEIKSKMLLPKTNKIPEDDETDPREELMKKLLEYNLYKEAAQILKIKAEAAKELLWREPDVTLADLKSPDVLHHTDEILEGLSLETLFAVFEETLKRRELKTDVVRNSFRSVKKDSYTVENKIKFMQELLEFNDHLNFVEVFSLCQNKVEKIVTFLAMLELIKLKEIIVTQSNTFGDIQISKYKR